MDDMEERLVRIEETARRNESRIDALEQREGLIHELDSRLRVISESLKRIEADVARLSAKVDALEKQDGKKWRALVGKVLELLAAAVIGFLAARIGLK